MMVTLTKNNINSEIQEGLILVDVWAPWCPPCRAMEPILEVVAEELEGKARIGKLNADDEMEVASKLGVTGLPTFLVFKDGELVARQSGMMQKDRLIELVLKA